MVRGGTVCDDGVARGGFAARGTAMQEDRAASQGEPEMVEEVMWVRRPAVGDLSRSQKDPGSFTLLSAYEPSGPA